MAQQLERLLGPTLLGRNGAVPTSSVDAEVVGLYFSAHWCPPCRQFTPMLARRYNELMSKRRSFEVVFVSSDHDPGSFQEYFHSMPWLALPFGDRLRKAQLSQMFGVSGIPTLVLLDSAGRLIDRNGRQKVMEPLFEQQVGLKVDPEVKGLTLESIIDVMSTDLRLDHDARLAGYNILYKIVNNILQYPGDPKYLTLKKTNATVQAKYRSTNVHIRYDVYLCGDAPVFVGADTSYTLSKPEGDVCTRSRDGGVSSVVCDTGGTVEVNNGLLGDQEKVNFAHINVHLANRGFIKILKLAGFEETADSYKCSEYPDNIKLKEVRDVLGSLISSMQ